MNFEPLPDPLEIATHTGTILLKGADLFRVSVPMREPFRISSGEIASKDALLLRVGDGTHSGWGESSAMGGSFYSAETPDGCETELVDHVLPNMLGHEFSSMLAFESALCSLTENRFVRVAMETAAWELIALRKQVSLRQLFGISDRPIPSGLAIGLYPEISELKDAIRRYEFHRYHRLKVKIKRGQDIEVVRGAREVAGDFPLFVDANADYTMADLDTFLHLDKQDLMMFEQPFAKEDLAGSAELQRGVRTPVCFDESIETAADLERSISMNACKIVNIKLQRVGGYLPAFRILSVCARHGIPVWMGTMPELGIGSAQALMLAAHPLFTFPTDVEPSERWYLDDVIKPSLQLVDGCLHLQAASGLGVQVDPAKLERYTVSSQQFC